MKSLTVLLLLMVVNCSSGIVMALENTVHRVSIDLQPARSGTYYLSGKLTPLMDINLLLDTGSSFTIFDHSTLQELLALGVAEYKDMIIGVMADGSERQAKVYVINQLMVGDCRISNLEVVAFTSKATFVLGINALKQLSPFSIDINEKALTAHCIT